MMPKKEYEGDIGLSKRQRQIVEALVSGLRIKQIGPKLGISEHTVKIHLYELRSKFQVNDSLGIVVKAHKLGLIDIGLIG